MSTIDHAREAQCGLGSLWLLALLALATFHVASPIAAQKRTSVRSVPHGATSHATGAAPFFSVRGEQKISSLEGGFPVSIPENGRFGWASAALGDLDQDGVPDIAVSALDMGDEKGLVWVLFLNSDGTVKSAQPIGEGLAGFSGTFVNPANFGTSLASIGDVNGDGIPDLAVASTSSLSPVPALGHAVWILFLNRNGTVLFDQEISVRSGEHQLVNGGRFGDAVCPLGDLDGDGVPDIAVGDRSDAGTNSSSAVRIGAVWILFLRSDGTVKREQRINSQEGGLSASLPLRGEFGRSLALLGDLDGDGAPEIAVGAGNNSSHQAVWILFLQRDGTVLSEVKIADGEGGFGGQVEFDDFFGQSVAALGDTDGDGTTDLVVGIPGYGVIEGGFWLLRLRPDGHVRAWTRVVQGRNGFTGPTQVGDLFGWSIAFPGDIDGDGIGDLIVGAQTDDDGPGFGANGALWVLFLDSRTTLDFECEDDLVTPLRNGQAIRAGQEFGRLVTISSWGYGQYGPAIFDSAPDGANDPGADFDLLVGRGHVLILQEQQRQSVSGIFDLPDDSQLGGTLSFDFAQPVELIAIDLIDICPGTPLQDVRVELFCQAGGTRTYHVPGGWTEDLVIEGGEGRRRLSLTTLGDQPGHLSVATATETPAFDPKTVVRLDITLASSGAVDHLVIDTTP